MREILEFYGYQFDGDAVYHNDGYWRGVIDDANKVVYLKPEVGLTKETRGDYREICVINPKYGPYQKWDGPKTVNAFMAAVLLGEIEVLGEQ